MKRTIASLTLALSLSVGSLTGCSFFLGDTKTAQGQLYQSGDTRYDPYFDTVHREQIAAASWSDNAKESRKPIVTALNLAPGASNGTILTATREMKSGAAALGLPIEQTTAAETERAKKLSGEVKRLEELKEQGQSLRKQAATDKENMGAQKADDKQVAKKDEVKRELGAAIDALEKLINEGRRHAREAEELSTKLTAAWTGRPEDEKTAAKPDEKPAPGKKPEPVAKKPEPKPKATAPAKPSAAQPAAAAAPADPPPPKPPPATKPPDEVFNP